MTLEEAFNAHYQELIHFGKKLVKDKQAVEDIVSDIFVRLNNCDIENLRGYLYTCVKNRCINYLEYIKSHRTEEIIGDVWIEETAMIEADFLKKMYAAIAHLSKAEKEVIDLLLKGKSHADAGRILNKGAPTIRSIKRSAIAKLRKAILTPTYNITRQSFLKCIIVLSASRKIISEIGSSCEKARKPYVNIQSK
jgi:RNA polymerase sigma factor (sigma-70 family)